MDTLEARRQAEAQWTANPCGAIGGSNTTLDYFLAVERARYTQQSWQRDYFAFDSFGGKRVLEIGVGQGTDLVQFAQGGAECYGIDITDAHLILASRNFRLRGLTVDLRKADATTIPYPDGYFDAVYSFGVLHHIPDAEAVIREIRRVLKPGGEVMLAVYHRHSKDHASLFVRGLLSGRLFKVGYSGLLATIEAGANGTTIKPYVRLYSKADMRRVLSGFTVRDISIKQLHAPRAPFLSAFEGWFGWYVACQANSPCDSRGAA